MTAALSADRMYRTRGRGDAISVDLAVAAVWQGGLVAENAAGYGIAAASTAGLRVRGICTASVDNTGGSAGAAAAPVLTNLYVLLDNSTTHAVAQTDVGHPCWVETDHSVCGAAGGSSVFAGIVDRLVNNGTQVWVYVSDSAAHLSDVRAAPEAIAASGALSTTVLSTVNSSAGALALTLANGSYEGQQKWVFLKTAGHNAVITPATFADGATITLSAASQFWGGEWHSDGWHNLATTGAIA